MSTVNVSNYDSLDPVRVEIAAARIKLLLEKPFFGNMATRLIPIEAPWTRTAATDGRHLYYNREFIKGLSKPNLLFLICHEVYHGLLDHLGRRGNRDPKIWNMACDYIVNYSLVREKIGAMPEMGLYDPRYTDDMSVDEVYDLLKKNAVTIKMPLDDHLELGDDSSEGDDGDPIDREGGNKRKGTKPGNDNQPGSGNQPGRDVEVTVMGHNGPPKLSEDDVQAIRNEIKAAVLQVAQQVGAGNLPAGIKRLISELVEPKMDWRTLIDAHIRSQVKADYTLQRLSRRTWATGMILPAQDNIERVECWCAIDASASTTEEMVTAFVSEMKGIMETFADFHIGVLCFDTEVYNIYEFTPENFDDVYGYTIRGGGGTLFESIYEYFKSEDIQPTRLAIFTDGLPNSGWGDENYCDTIFVIHSNPHITAPYGVTCHFDDEPKTARARL